MIIEPKKDIEYAFEGNEVDNVLDQTMSEKRQKC